MRVGICSWWFNRGQAVVGRHLRSALTELGHETFVLARPARPNAPKPSFIDRGDVWDQPGVTEASAFEIPLAEYEAFAETNALDAILFDQNYQFEEISRLRASGVRTIGRFVWEAFSPEHIPDARKALDVIYSLTGCEHERYRELGIDSPRVHWGIHPETLPDSEPAASGSDGQQADSSDAVTNPAGADAEALREYVPGESRAIADPGTPGREAEDVPGRNVVFMFPGGYMTKRKPLAAVLAAFDSVGSERARLLIKAQVDRKGKRLRKAAASDSRIELITDDLSNVEYQRLFASADVCLAPSRWEGLGLHLYEATALGLPIITNDNPPMNELVEDGVNGLLVRGIETDEPAPSGIAAFDPDVGQLARAIERAVDDDERASLSRGALDSREDLRWERTVTDLGALLELVDVRP